MWWDHCQRGLQDGHFLCVDLPETAETARVVGNGRIDQQIESTLPVGDMCCAEQRFAVVDVVGPALRNTEFE